MDPQRKEASRDTAWELVEKNEWLSGEAKIAWLHLWRQAGSRPGTVHTSPGEIGERQGHDRRAGLRYLKALASGGWIEISDRHEGRWVVYVVDPAELAIARRRTHDPQRDLFGHEDDGERGGEEAAQLASSPPADEAGADMVPYPPTPKKPQVFRNLREKDAHLKPLPSEPSVPSTFVPSEPSVPSLKPLGALVRQAAENGARRRPGDPEIERAIDERARDLIGKLPSLRRTPAQRVARAVVLGEINWSEVKGAIEWVLKKYRDRELKGTPGAAFCGTMKPKFLERGLDWPEPNSGG